MTTSTNGRGRPTALPEIDRAGTKRCAICGPKPLTDFYRNARSRDTLQAVCKECQRERIARSFENDEQRKAANAAYMREYRRSALNKTHQGVSSTPLAEPSRHDV